MDRDDKLKILTVSAKVAAVLGASLFVFYMGYREGHIDVTAKLDKEYREKTAKVLNDTEKEVSRIRRHGEKDAEREMEPLKRLQVREKELLKRKAKASETISARSFAEDQGLGELAQDAMRIEQSCVEVGKQCRRIRLLHASLGKRQWMSSTIRQSSGLQKEIVEAHRKIMGDMKYASEANATIRELTR